MLKHKDDFGENKTPGNNTEGRKLGYKDSNLEMTESESVALPFGDTPKVIDKPLSRLHYVIIGDSFSKIKYFLKKFFYIPSLVIF